MADHHLDVVDRRLAALVGRLGGRDVLDVGGGSGTRAVPLAELGCRVTVVDSSTDALASLVRRAAEAGVADRIHAVQADADQIESVAGVRSADLVLVHSVVDDADDPVAVLAAAARTVRPGGLVSVLVAGRFAALMRETLAGRYRAARTVIDVGAGSRPDAAAASDAVPGAPGEGGAPADGLYDVAALTRLLGAAGLRAESIVGVGVISGLAGAAGRPLVDGPDLEALEDAMAVHPVGRELAVSLHAVAAPIGAGPATQRSAAAAG